MAGPVTNSAESFLTGRNPHEATPVGGTYKREADGQPAHLTNAGDYPVTARCRFCEVPVRLSNYLQWSWLHAPAETARSAGGAT